MRVVVWMRREGNTSLPVELDNVASVAAEGRITLRDVEQYNVHEDHHADVSVDA